MTAYAINKVCWLLERDAEFRGRMRRDLDAALTGFKLAPDEAQAIRTGDVATLFRKGGHAFLLQHLWRHGIGGLDRTLYRQRITSLNENPEPGG
jgi:hypothetical protein